jgi:hypothetical protein
VASARAAGLVPVSDLSHLPRALQATALWLLADGGFERRVTHGVISRGAHDVDVTAFDLETLRERRGEWASLSVERPFRIGGVLGVVACQLDREFAHVLLKRDGGGDDLDDDTLIDRGAHIQKMARTSLGIARAYPLEPPPSLSVAPLAPALPPHWRAYGAHGDQLATMLGAGFGAALEAAGRRDLVVELVGSLVVVYPATRDVGNADAFADLTETVLGLAFAALAATPALSQRGVEVRT